MVHVLHSHHPEDYLVWVYFLTCSLHNASRRLAARTVELSEEETAKILVFTLTREVPLKDQSEISNLFKWAPPEAIFDDVSVWYRACLLALMDGLY